MSQLISWLNHAIQLLLIPICLVSAWTFMVLISWSMWTAARDSVNVAQEMHQIPCSKCQFFTADYRLKCTVHPSTANTPAAINCPDYQAKN
jgi:hypothetical protein